MRPSSLFRSDSTRQPTIEATANNIPQDSIDCGITALRCCNTPKCQKLGNKKSFLGILISMGIVQGAIEVYFQISAKQAAIQHGFASIIVDWLLVSSGILQGLFAIVVAYWANRLHRPAWIGGIVMIQAVTCLLIIVPTLVHHGENNDTIEAVDLTVLCVRNTIGNLHQENPHAITTLILMFVLQFTIGLGHIALFALGLTYIDDNVHEHESPALIAAALAARYWGSQLGSLLSLIIGMTTLGWWLGWTVLSPILFVIGFLVVLFPKHLISTVIRQAANNIVDTFTSSNGSLPNPTQRFIADIDFVPSIKRIITNKILLFNILAAVFIQTAFINFTRHESNYLQSRFFLPTSDVDGLDNEWTSRIVSSLLRPPMVALAILVAGLLIAKGNPNPRKLVAWNIIAATLVVLFFIGSIFLDCENSPIAGAHRGRINQPYCSRDCFCSPDVPFTPVCPENGIRTYYSPCHAGCSAQITINDVRVYGNCSCGVDTEMPIVDLIATEGACGMSDCQPYWIIFQTLFVVSAALLGSTWISKVIISLRCVLHQDKSIALALELCIAGLIIYIPGKIIYRVLANNTCQYFASDNFQCFLQESPTFGNWISIISASFIFIGILFEVLVFILIKDLPLYGEDPDDVYKPIEMEQMIPPAHPTVADTLNNDNSNEADRVSQDTLLPQQPITSIQDSYYPSRSFSPIGSDRGEIAYAKIVHPKAQSAIPTEDQLDFRIKAPSIQNDEVSSISSGYVNINATTRNRNGRPLSPETDF